MSKEIASTGDQQISAERQNKYAAYVQDTKALAPKVSDSNALTLKASGFFYGKNKLGTSIDVVAIAFGYKQSYFDPAIAFNPEQPMPPICYALNKDAALLKPAEHGLEIQHGGPCSECHFSQFKSAENGKGKACKEYISLALVHTDDIDSKAPLKVVTLQLPPTAHKQFAEVSSGILDVLKMPIFTAALRLSIVDLPMGFSVETELLGIIEEDDIIDDRIIPLIKKSENELLEDPLYDYEELEALKEKPKKKSKAASGKFSIKKGEKKADADFEEEDIPM